MVIRLIMAIVGVYVEYFMGPTVSDFPLSEE